MSALPCPHCGSAVSFEALPVRFCPFCGGSLATAEPPPLSALERRVQAERKPQKKYALIQAVLQANPDDFAANRALLFHGRLHEPPQRGRTLVFSNIKCHLLSIFENPAQYDEATLAAKHDELLRGPQLLRTMALAPNADAFFAFYLDMLAGLYIELFIRGDSRVRTYAFGFQRSDAAMARQAADPVRRMLVNIQQSPRLTEAERALLLQAVRKGFAQAFPGYREALEQ